MFLFAAQSPWSRILQSPWVRSAFAIKLTETALRTHGDCSTTLANERRLRCESYRYNGNDVVDCLVINLILRHKDWSKGNGK